MKTGNDSTVQQINESRAVLIGEGVERLSHLRTDPAWLAQRFNDPATRFLPSWKSRQLFSTAERPEPVLLGPESCRPFLDASATTVFLGGNHERFYFAVDLSDIPGFRPENLEAFGAFQDLRRVGPLLSGPEASLLAYARALLHWNRRHRFCGDCGSPTRIADGGHRRLCTDDSCGQEHFPRTDPAVIVLVRWKEEVLLGRQSIWPQGFYSTIAGFVEPGETLEAAVEREIREETGVRVRDIHYFASQPWPFPGSLMMGFTAWAEAPTIHRVDHELEDARWFSREAFLEGLESGSLLLPTTFSIAFHLIRHWFDDGSPLPLTAFSHRTWRR